MKPFTSTLLVLVLGVTVSTASVARAQTAAPQGQKKPHRALRATLGAVAGAGLGALWVVKLCPTGSDSPSLCYGPPIAFVIGGAVAGARLDRTPAFRSGPPSRDSREGGMGGGWTCAAPTLTGRCQNGAMGTTITNDNDQGLASSANRDPSANTSPFRGRPVAR